MTKKILFLLLIVSQLSFGQTASNPWSIGAHYGLTGYNGDWGSNLFGPVNGMGPVIKATVGKYLNKSFGLELHTSYNEWSFAKKDSLKKFNAEFFNYGTNLQYKFNNGYILKEDAFLAPYLTAGLGFVSTKSNETKRTTDFAIPVGLGLKIRLYEDLHLVLQSVYGLTWNDGHDLNRKKTGNDNFMQHTVGVVYSFSCEKKDSDNDGVADSRDICPNTPAGAVVNKEGCPVDTDGDGIADYMDKCPSEKGIQSKGGCPVRDADGDGVEDEQDACMSVFGLAKLNGCPDTDADGIADKDDNCPNEKGTVAAKGCPDSDGDGVVDSKDECPSVFGLASFNGCPDSDKDGIADKNDKCPNEPGTAANNGCPEVKPVVNQIKVEDQQKLDVAIKNINFETGKDVLLATSYASLNTAASILKSNANYNLNISGHTDNVGDANRNLDLSSRRATAVMNYLIKQGVSSSRLKAAGYGATMPIADNNTAAGRAQNRRVELKLY